MHILKPYILGTTREKSNGVRSGFRNDVSTEPRVSIHLAQFI